MATKKFTVIDTRNNVTKAFESAATTLGELKRELAAIGIETSNMAIQEALTKTELLNDASVLPKDVLWHGVVTNDLVFRITQNNKNIKSGATRAECYTFIKANNLAEAVKRAFGRNFTQVATESLERFIQSCVQSCNCSEEERNIRNLDSAMNNAEVLRKAIGKLVEILRQEEVIDEEDATDILAPLGLLPNEEKSDSPYSNEQLDEILSNLD